LLPLVERDLPSLCQSGSNTRSAYREVLEDSQGSGDAFPLLTGSEWWVSGPNHSSELPDKVNRDRQASPEDIHPFYYYPSTA